MAIEPITGEPAESIEHFVVTVVDSAVSAADSAALNDCLLKRDAILRNVRYSV